jgi:hypothetical protein
MTFWCLSLAGQEKAVMKTGINENILNQGVQLRAGGTMPDSMITYAATGEKSSRTVFTYNADGRIAQEEIFNWENNRWVNVLKWVYEYDNPPIDGVDCSRTKYTWESGRWVEGRKTIVRTALDRIIYENSDIFWPSPGEYAGGIGFGFTGDGWKIYKYKVISENDSKGNLVSVEFHTYEIANPDNSHLAYRFAISYNDRSQPISIRGYEGNLSLFLSVDYQYDSEGNTVFYEYLYFEDSGNMELHQKYTSVNGVITVEIETAWDNTHARTVSKTDSDGNIYLKQYFTFTGEKMYLTHYDIYYPNSLTPSATETIAGAAIWSYGSNLYVRTPQPVALYVYTVAGTLYRQQTLPAGETAIPLPQGIYFVQTGKTVKKILIR